MNLSAMANLTIAEFQPLYSWAHAILVSLLLGLLIVLIICGNALVVAAVLQERHLRVVSNYLILSLAVADLLVALIVMPLSAIKEISLRWWLGLHLCDLWVCADVLLCTVSILHLCAIAIERYLAVSSIHYLQNRSATLVLIMVAICWILSIMVSLPARFHYNRSPSEYHRVTYEGVCNINTETGYTIYSNLLAFDLPMAFMIIVYAKIYVTARRHIRKRTISKQANSNKSEAASHRACWGGCIECSKRKKSTIYCENDSRSPCVTITHEDLNTDVCRRDNDRNSTKQTRETKRRSGNIQTSETMLTESEISVDAVDEKPLTYEILKNIRHLVKHKEDCQSWALSNGIPKDYSNSTIASSIKFADETPKNISFSPSLYSNCFLQVDLNSSVNDYKRKISLNSNIFHMDNSAEHDSNQPDSTTKRKFHMMSSFYTKWKKTKRKCEHHVFERKTVTEENRVAEFVLHESDLLAAESINRARLEQKRESRAIRTLAIITGCFVLCWLPFNINALLSPFVGKLHPLGCSVLLWLGYVNSLLNPAIYTIFSPEFRHAFRKILCGRRFRRIT